MTRQMIALLSLVLLCLVACDKSSSVQITGSSPTQQVGHITPTALAPTATMVPVPTFAPTPTPTFAPAPTPPNVPSGWQVLAGRYFSIAYPFEWVIQQPHSLSDTPLGDTPGYIYTLSTSDGRILTILERWDGGLAHIYCNSPIAKDVILGDVTMRYSHAGNNNEVRDWFFADSHSNIFDFTLNDANSPQNIALDNKLLTTIRLIDHTAFTC